MIGDIINTKPHHEDAARQIFEFVKDELNLGRPVFTVAGQSGAGKSEIAHELGKILEQEGMKTYVFAQDDYFQYPPKTNHQQRLADINWVGTKEVKLSLLDQHIAAFKHTPSQLLEKPLVVFKEDRISSEKIDLSRFTAAIAEGTYTTLLTNADFHVFIDRDYHDTKADRVERGRDTIDEFSERIMKIEHEIISKHRELARFVVDKKFKVTDTNR